MRIKKGDQVKILSGRDRGKSGAVIRVFPETHRLTVDGLNLYKKRTRPRKQGQKGETVLVPRPLPASRVGIVCKSCKQATRVGMRVHADHKVRYCRKCRTAL